MYWIEKPLSCRVCTGTVLTGACSARAIETAISHVPCKPLALMTRIREGIL